jgi:Mn-containing catalase
MFFHVQKLINPIVADEPDPAAANALQEGLGGQFGEMRTMMQYLFQSFNFRGNAKSYFDLIQGVGIEEISHVELIATTINRLLDALSRKKWEHTGRRWYDTAQCCPQSRQHSPLPSWCTGSAAC